MRFATSLADRMLSALVPQKTAAAGCSGVFYQTCTACKSGKQKVQECNWHSNCTFTCSSCYEQSC